MNIKTKKIIAREVLLMILVIIYMFIVYIILNNLFDGDFFKYHKIKFNVLANDSIDLDSAQNSLILFAPAFILYLIRPLIFLIQWCCRLPIFSTHQK